MKKRILALLMAAAMLFALAACSNQADDTSDPPTGESTPASEPAGEEPGGETKTGTLKIGLLVHTTGWFAGVDTPNYNEFTALVDYINNDMGGWTVGDTTYQIEPVYADGQSDYPALRTAAMSLVDAGVDFVIETNDFWVNTCADVFEDEGIMHVSAYCTLAPDYIVEANPLAFTGSNGSAGDYATAISVLREYYPDVKSIVFCENDNGNMDITYPLVQSIAEENGIEVVGSIIYPGDTTDFSTVAMQIVDSGADCFFGNGSPDAYGAILKAVRAQGSDAVCACIQGKPASTLMEYAGADASSNAFIFGASVRESDRDKNTDIFNALVDKLTELYGEETAATVDGAAANSLYIVLQLMKQCGSVDPATVAAEWEKGGEIETIYGPSTIGGEETYGVANHAVGNPRAVSIIDPEAEGGWYFADWIPTLVP